MAAASISVEELVALVYVDPRRALDESHVRLAERPLVDSVAAELWRVAGLARRELGDLVAARADLERRARGSGSRGRPIARRRA